MLDYRDALKKEMKSPAFKEAWDSFSLEYELAGLLIRLRNEAGLSQAELARRVGTTQSAIARMESGKVIPRLESLNKIARACGKRLEIQAR
ncbi:MAG: helix-turn-helix domain-containing protein [Thermoanaerobacterales bacterium]|nr:helix-turn-helix domain-containing protein [Bacillota bacterium]MDI6908143.1 helix-turn-helix domain-containing protein [Thermoanaerobacterales bacterium]